MSSNGAGFNPFMTNTGNADFNPFMMNTGNSNIDPPLDLLYPNYLLIKEQNETLQENITEIKERYSTDDQLFNYIGTSWGSLITINGMLLIIYYILFFGVTITLFVSQKNTMGTYSKLAVIALLGILPFIYLWIEIFIWEIIKYIWSLLRGYVYQPGIHGRAGWKGWEAWGGRA